MRTIESEWLLNMEWSYKYRLIKKQNAERSYGSGTIDAVTGRFKSRLATKRKLKKFKRRSIAPNLLQFVVLQYGLEHEQSEAYYKTLRETRVDGPILGICIPII